MERTTPLAELTSTLPEAEVPARPDIDERGVDRAQVRRMLALSPLQRIEWLEALVRDIVAIRERNEKPAVR